jgi:hypothetical protein
MEQSMWKYDKNTGDNAELNDSVKIVNLTGPMLNMTGSIGGWGDYTNYLAIVLLDTPVDGVRAVNMPVVCLQKIQ